MSIDNIAREISSVDRDINSIERGIHPIDANISRKQKEAHCWRKFGRKGFVR